MTVNLWKKRDNFGYGDKNAVRTTDRDAQYDESAKRLLGNKNILAHILAKTVDEFKGMNPKEAETFIEAQKDAPTEYKLLNRAVFYVSRLVSYQKERDFINTNYNDIKRVFSIWVCMNMDENTMNYVHLVDDKLLGNYQCNGGLDLLNIVMIGIADKLPEHDERYELHCLLGALLSRDLSEDEKLDIIETECHIPIEDDIRKDVNVMCNLSQGIKEEGIAISEARGEAKGKAAIIINMYKKGISLEEIAEKSVKEVQAIIDGKEPMPA